MMVFSVPLTLRSSIIVGAAVIGAYVIFGGPRDVRKKKKKNDYVPGLANIGNSCFLNALVQSLASCPLFISWLGSKPQQPSQPLVSTLYKLLQVLNNSGDHKGDACAGEVMRALRGHGWVISSEEQDAHELFHALTATIHEELINANSFPSLLDISWIDGNGVDITQIADDGVASRFDCIKKSVIHDCDDNPTYNSEIPKLSSRIKTFSNNVVSNSLELSLTDEINTNGAINSSVSGGDKNTSSAHDFRCKVDCDLKGCENEVKASINGHDGDISSLIIKNGINDAREGLSDLKPENDILVCGIDNDWKEVAQKKLTTVNTEKNNDNFKDAGTHKKTSDTKVGHSFQKEVANAQVNASLQEQNSTYQFEVPDQDDALSNSLQDPEIITSIQVPTNSQEEEPTRKLSTSDEPTRELSTSDEPTRKLSTSDESTRKLSTSDEPTRKLSTSDEPTRKLSTSSVAIDKLNLRQKNKQHDSPFQGYLASQLQCTLCGYKNPAQWTSFESLSLSLPSLPWGEVTLQELLDSYITQEKVSDVTCDSCTKNAGADVKTSFTKQLTIGKLPNCLCFHIKRTVWMENGCAVKRQDHVLFPEFLTMDPYTYVTSVNNQGQRSGLLGGRESSVPTLTSSNGLESISSYQPSSIMSRHANSSEINASPFFRVTRVQCDQLYRLKAVIVHVGDVFCGHFVTYRRGALGTRNRNRWYYTSDLAVRESNLEEVRKANAYMIMYEKVTE